MGAIELFSEWTDIELAARRLFLWLSVTNKWVERDRATAIKMAHLEHVGPDVTPLPGDDNNWVLPRWQPPPQMLWVPKEAEEIRILWRMEDTTSVAIVDKNIRFEIGVGSGNYTNIGALPGLGAGLQSTCFRDITSDGINESIIDIQTEVKIDSSGAGGDYFLGVYSYLTLHITDDLN